jgi:starch phosphorylase
VQRVKRSLITLGPFVTAARMVRDYTEQLYEPTAIQTDALAQDHHTVARSLASWKAQVEAAWAGVHVDRVDVDEAVADLGTERAVNAIVSLGELTPEDVEVQLLHGPAGQADELTASQVVVLDQAGPADDGHLRYRGTFACDKAGRYGVTVRIVPNHPSLVTPVELGRIAWG